MDQCCSGIASSPLEDIRRRLIDQLLQVVSFLFDHYRQSRNAGHCAISRAVNLESMETAKGIIVDTVNTQPDLSNPLTSYYLNTVASYSPPLTWRDL